MVKNLYIVILFLLSVVIISAADNKENNRSNSGYDRSTIIIENGAKVYIDKMASAMIRYDDIILQSGAKLSYAEDEFDLALSNENPVESLSLSNVALPIEFEVSEAFPNPFNPSVQISYGLPKASHVNISIHDLSGRMIAKYNYNQQNAGWHEFNWNALILMARPLVQVYIY